MAEAHPALFMDWELESSIDELKREKQLSAPQRRHYNLCRRKVRNNTLVGLSGLPFLTLTLSTITGENLK